jgi:hypothetical protein
LHLHHHGPANPLNFDFIVIFIMQEQHLGVVLSHIAQPHAFQQVTPLATCLNSQWPVGSLPSKAPIRSSSSAVTIFPAAFLAAHLLLSLAFTSWSCGFSAIRWRQRCCRSAPFPEKNIEKIYFYD